MGMYLNSASGSLALANSLYQTSVVQTNILNRLSSGIRINSASDDAAGLSLSQKLASVINGNTIAKNNAQTGISYLNTADSALSTMTDSLTRIRNLAVQAANGVYSQSERQMLQNEVTQLSSNINQTYLSTKFGTKSVFGGDASVEHDAAIAAGYDDAHIITSAQDFVNKVTANLTGNFVMTTDIDMSTLGTFTKAVINGTFSGTFDGNGHTISGAKITATSANSNIGIFSQNSGTIKNLAIQNASLNCTGTGSGATCYAGILIGRFLTGGSLTDVTVSDSTITLGDNWQGIGIMSAGGLGAAGNTAQNCSVTNSNIYGGDNCRYICGFGNPGTASIANCYFSGNISLGNNAVNVGGFRADVAAGYNAQNCYTTGTITVGNNSSGIAGFACSFDGGATVSNCYSTVDIRTGTNANRVGGFIDTTDAISPITNSYATGNISVGAGSVNVGGFAGTGGGSVNNTNFYRNNLHTSAGSAIDESVSSALPQSSWGTGVWDFSTSLPTLRNCDANMSATLQSSSKIQISSEADDTSQIDTLQRLVLNSVSFDISTQSAAQATITKIDSKMAQLNTYRSSVGSATNKLQSILNLQTNRITSLSESKSKILDTDIAVESANFIKTQIRQQAGTTLLSQTKNIDSKLLMSLLNNM